MMDMQNANLKVSSSDALSDENRANGSLDSIETQNQIPGPAGAEVDLDGVRKSSNLYPLNEDLNREGVSGHEDEDLGINADGTNPGTEYLPPLNELGEE